MKVILFTSVFYNNIGNGFIDIGAEATLKEILDHNELIKLSQCANFAASMDWKFRLRENSIVSFLWENLRRKFAKKIHDKAYSMIRTENVLSMALIAQCDWFIIPGCVLTVPFFTIYGEFLKSKTQQGCKVLFLGASGNHYTQEEVSIVRQWLEIIRPEALIFRDSVAYNAYKDMAPYTYNGIDNVFFVNKADIPTFKTTVDPYYVLNFDLKENKHIQEELKRTILRDKNIIYTDHKPYPQSKIEKEVKKNVIISDYPYDYLAVYKNVETTYSDRVHACIPTLSFGNKARLYSVSPRKALFENVGLSEIFSQPVKCDGLEEYQYKQIQFLKRVLNS